LGPMASTINITPPTTTSDHTNSIRDILMQLPIT
jgi:hypothetical protein